MAVMREKPEPLLDDLLLCIQLGWTPQELYQQDAKTVEIIKLYLSALAEKQRREGERAKVEMERLKRRFRM